MLLNFLGHSRQVSIATDLFSKVANGLLLRDGRDEVVLLDGALAEVTLTKDLRHDGVLADRGCLDVVLRLVRSADTHALFQTSERRVVYGSFVLKNLVDGLDDVEVALLMITMILILSLSIWPLGLRLIFHAYVLPVYKLVIPAHLDLSLFLFMHAKLACAVRIIIIVILYLHLTHLDLVLHYFDRRRSCFIDFLRVKLGSSHSVIT